MSGPEPEPDPEVETAVREHLSAIEHEIRGVGQFEARRIVRRVKAWASHTESALLQGDAPELDDDD